MNAIAATPVTDLRVTIEPTREHPRKLCVSRQGDYVHASLMVRVRETWESLGWLASDEPMRIRLAAFEGPMVAAHRRRGV